MGLIRKEDIHDSFWQNGVSNPNLLINSPTIGYVSAGTYGNSTYTRNNYWMIF